MAIAMLRLLTRAGLDADPLIGELEAEAAGHRKARSAAGRSAARRAAEDGAEEGDGPGDA